MIYTHELLTLWLVEAYCMLPNMGERDDGNGGMQFFGKGANAIRPYRGKGQPQGIALTILGECDSPLQWKGRPQGSPLRDCFKD